VCQALHGFNRKAVAFQGQLHASGCERPEGDRFGKGWGSPGKMMETMDT